MGATQDSERGLAIDGAGNALLTGTTSGLSLAIDVGGGVMSVDGECDILIARFAP